MQGWLQPIIEILYPGPLEGRAGQWNRDQRQRAQEQVGQAIRNFTLHSMKTKKSFKYQSNLRENIKKLNCLDDRDIEKIIAR